MTNLEPKTVEIKKKQMIITVGMSGSGKSQWASNFKVRQFSASQGLESWVSIDRNDIRFKKLLMGNGWQEYKVTKEKEEIVSKFVSKALEFAFSKNQNIIISDNNLSKGLRDKWYDLGIKNGYHVAFKYFPLTLNEAYERDQYRGAYSVGRERLNSEWKQWLLTDAVPIYVPDTTLKSKVLIVDVETSLFHSDNTPNLLMCNLIALYITRFNASVIYLSSHHDKHRESKLKWLRLNMGFTGTSDILVMRVDEVLQDNYVQWKQKKLWEFGSNNHIIGVIDSDPNSVEMWHDSGIQNVISLADPRKIY